MPNVMGILNVTPDSFSDGGRFSSIDVALQYAQQMIADGATVIDIGGESTRPGADPVTEAEELARVIPAVEAIAQRFDVVISVDTSTPAVISESAAAGAHLVNDVRSLCRDGALAAAAQTGLPVCLMHWDGDPQAVKNAPEYQQPIEELVKQFLQQRVSACEDAGIGRDKILLDPGFGFGKNHQHNYRLLNRLESLHELGLPLLTGLSRKRMIGEASGVDVADERVIGSVTGAVICAMKGAKILRVHDVKETAQAIRVLSATLREGNE